MRKKASDYSLPVGVLEKSLEDKNDKRQATTGEAAILLLRLYMNCIASCLPMHAVAWMSFLLLYIPSNYCVILNALSLLFSLHMLYS